MVESKYMIDYKGVNGDSNYNHNVMILAAGMEEGWTEPEYENRVDSLPPLDESFGDPLPDFKAEIQDGRIFIIALVILGLLALGWIVARFMEKREKSSKELDHMIKDLEDRRDNQ